MKFQAARNICYIVVICLFCASCNYYSGNNGGRSSSYGSLSDPRLKTGPAAYGSMQAGGRVIHNNTKLQYSEELSKKIEHLNGVAAAFVMLTDADAYVAILFDRTATGTHGIESKNETNNSVVGSGQTKSFKQNGASNLTVEPWKLAANYNTYDTIEDSRDIVPAFKQKIALTLRAAKPSLHEVFISANRDFINQLNSYAIEIWSGRSINGHLQEFNNTVNRLFSQPDQ